MIDAMRAFGLEELAAQNGHVKERGFPSECFGCAKDFLSARRPSATRRSWCPECVAAGRPSAQRQADLRKRRSKIPT